MPNLYWWKHNNKIGQYSSAKVHHSLHIEQKNPDAIPVSIDDYTINKYVYSLEDSSFADMRNDLGLSAEESRGFYRAFVGVERLVGYSLAQSNQASIRNLGEIIAAVELSASELHDIDEERVVDHDFDERIENGSNVLLYGVPGSGKSWTIEREY